MVRLTQYARGGGCAAKLRLSELTKVLGAMPAAPARDDVLIDHAFNDDAAVVASGGPRDLVLTTDTIAPLVDDPFQFGQIAATNAMSDVWAMGGEPRWALNLVFFSDEQLPLDVLDQILAGGAAACASAGVAVVGGHSVRDPELKFGLAVTGDVAKGQAWSNRNARPGQALVLTKAIGTGILAQAIKKGVASAESAAAAIASMTTLNQRAAMIARDYGVTAATDVTGFGLLGHLRNLVRGSAVTATVELSKIPLLPDAHALLVQKLCPAGSKANRAYVAELVKWADGSPLAAEEGDGEREQLASLACDAQTSGGLLLCVPADRAEALVAALGAPAAIVGHLGEGGAPITLA